MLFRNRYWVSLFLTGWLLVIAGVGGETLDVPLRRRIPAGDDSGRVGLYLDRQTWAATETAAIVCDMWDTHWCRGAAERVVELAPAMNDFLKDLRARGVLIIHAPSATLDFYKDHAGRLLAKNAPRADNLPEGIESWRHWMDEAEKSAGYPIDHSDGGCDCEVKCPLPERGQDPWTRQIATIDIAAGDAISDSGVEVWNLLEARGIDNVLLMGVHTNMCVSGRPFGLRNLARFGKKVALVRDMTDTMYNSEKAPQVSHFSGTDLIIEHIERYIAPTVATTFLTGKPAWRFREDRRPRAVFIIAENEYHAWETLPAFAAAFRKQHGFRVDFAIGIPPADQPESHYIADLENLEAAQVAVLYARRRALPPDQMERLRAYLNRGGSLVALRTSSHAFDARGKAGKGLAEWPGFDPEVLGGNYHNHVGKDDMGTFARVVPGMENHPILEGFPPEGFRSPSWLYNSRPLSPDCQALLTGEHPKSTTEPILWTRNYKGGRIVYNAMGHWDDFELPVFVGLLDNSIRYAADLE